MMDTKPLVLAISSRALFDLGESHRIYEDQGTEASCHYQIENENLPLAHSGYTRT